MIMQDKFYNIDKLELNEIHEILRESKKHSFEWWVDKLDCSEDISRKKVDMSFEDAMKKANDKSIYSFIHRYNNMMIGNSYYDSEEVDIFGRPREYLEVGYRTMDKIDYFLWIYVTIDKKGYFLNKYDLKLL